jgi:hypothetical protein
VVQRRMPGPLSEPMLFFCSIQHGNSLKAGYWPLFNPFQASRAGTSSFRPLLLVGLII